MSDIELVIKIPKKLACEGFDRPFTEDERSILIRAIGNGKLLPKGHGRLIDADKLEPKETSPEAWYSPMWGFELDDIEDAPTIIEADKTRDCNNCAYSDQGRCAGTEVCHECMWSNKFIETDKGSEDKG